MELKLYNYIKSNFFDSKIDFRIDLNQIALENLNENKLSLNEDYLKKIR